jgi:hypothetical protein
MVFVMYGAVLLIVFIAVVVASRKDTRLASNGRRHKNRDRSLFDGQSDCSLEASHVVDWRALRNHDCRGPCCRDKAALMPCDKTLLAS